MDNPAEAVSWSTPRPALIAVLVGGVVLATAAAMAGTDPAGRVLISIAALGLFVIAGLGWYLRPRLAILSDGRLVVRRLRGRDVLGRSDLTRVRVTRYPRLGRRVPMLEIDIREPERLLMFGRWDLGTHPDEVLDALTVHGLVPDDSR